MSGFREAAVVAVAAIVPVLLAANTTLGARHGIPRAVHESSRDVLRDAHRDAQRDAQRASQRDDIPSVVRVAAPHFAVPVQSGRSFLLAMMHADHIPALAVSVAVNGDIVWSEALGYANLESRAPATPQTRFRIASLSKNLTGTAVGRLIDRGRLDPDAPISRYVRDLPPEWRAMTARQIASHQSGIAYSWSAADDSNFTRYPSTASALAYFRDRPLLHVPGDKETYSSDAYTLLAAVIEGASGRPYLDFMRDSLFTPLGMTTTGPDESTAADDSHAAWYNRADSGRRVERAPRIELSGRWAGAGFLSTADDLTRFGMAHVKSGFLAESTLVLINARQKLNDGTLTREGFGWGPRLDWSGRPVMWGNGRIEGATSGLMVYRAPGVVVSILTNLQGAALDRSEVQAIAEPFVAMAQGTPVTTITPVSFGNYDLSIATKTAKYTGALSLRDSAGRPAGRFTIDGIKFDPVDFCCGWQQGDRSWLLGLDGAHSVFTMRLSVADSTTEVEAFRLLATVHATRRTGAPSVWRGDATVRFTHAHWFNGTGFDTTDVYVERRRFTRKAPAAIDTVIDLGGGYVVPPFAEAHNHNIGKVPTAAELAAYTRAGILYAMLPHVPIAQARADTARPSTSGMELAFADAMFTSPGSHVVVMTERSVERGNFPGLTKDSLNGKAYFIVQSPQDVARAWVTLAARRPHLVKVILAFCEEYGRRAADSSFVGKRGLDPALLDDLVQRSHRAGARVVAHIETAEDFRRAVRAGVDIIGHLPGSRVGAPAGFTDTSTSRWRLTAADAREAARRGTIIITTTVAGKAIVTPDRADNAVTRALHQHNIQTLRRAGVKLVVGSDFYESNAVLEAFMLGTQPLVPGVAPLGAFSNLELLQLWSQATPRALFPGRAIGALRDGYEASLLVLAGDPLTDFSNVRRIRLRMKSGRMIP